MSYDITIKRKGNDLEDEDDEDQLQVSDPVLWREFKNQGTTIEQALHTFNFKLRELENYEGAIGTQNDNEGLRTKISDCMQKCIVVMKQCRNLIQQFGYIRTSTPQEARVKQEKVKAYNFNFEENASKFTLLSEFIKDKELEYIEFAEKVRNSKQFTHTHTSLNSDGSLDDNQKMLLTQKYATIQMTADVDDMEELIKTRKQNINQIESIMTNINQIAKDIVVENNEQGQKLRVINQTMITTQEITKDGLNELKEANETQKKRGCKSLVLIASIAIVIIIVVVGVIVLGASTTE